MGRYNRDIFFGSGTQGPAGPAGADGVNLFFPSVAARDSFFQTSPDELKTDLPISVTTGTNTVAIQMWSGATSPAVYTPSTDSHYWRAVSYEAGTQSYKLREIHSMSSVGENVTFQNLRTDIHWFPAWQGLGDHSVPASRIVYNPTVRKYDDFTEEETNGPKATTGAVDYSDSFTLTRNETVFGIQIEVAEDYTGRLDYTLVDSTDSRIMYDDSQDVTLSTGDTLNFWPNCPSEIRTGTQITASITKEDGTLLQVRPSSTNPTMPYLTLRFRVFRDVNVIDREATSEVRDMLQELTADDRLDASAIKNIPTDDENVRDTVAAFLRAGTNISIVHDDAGDTLTISSTAPPSTPTAAITNFSINIDPVVQIGTDLNVAKTVQFTTQNTSDFTALTLVVTTGTDITLTVPTTDGSHSQNVTLSGIDTSSAGTLIFQIQGTTSGGQTVSSNPQMVTIRTTPDHEFGYYGVRSSNDFSTVDLSDLTRFDVTQPGTTFDVDSLSFPSQEYFGILLPEDRELTRLTNPNAPDPSSDIRGDFVTTVATRQVNSTNFTSYVEQNLSSFTGTLTLRGTTE